MAAGGALVWRDPCERTLAGAADAVLSATVSSDGRWLAAASHNLAAAPLSPSGPCSAAACELSPSHAGGGACCKRPSMMSRLLQSPLLGLSGLWCAEPKPKPAAGAASLRVWDTQTWQLRAELTGDAHRIAAVRFLAAAPPTRIA